MTAREFMFRILAVSHTDHHHALIERLEKKNFSMDKDGFGKSAIMDFLDIARAFERRFTGTKQISVIVDGHFLNYTIKCFSSQLFRLFLQYDSKIKDVTSQNIVTYLKLVWYPGREEPPEDKLLQLLDKLLDNLETRPECPDFLEDEEWKSRFQSFVKSANKA